MAGMLSPEVSTFEETRPWRRSQTGLNLQDIFGKQDIEHGNEVVESVKIFIPECLHPPDNLRNILIRDRDYYTVKNLSSIECCATDEFIQAFVCGGSIYMQSIYGKLVEMG